MTRAVDPPLLEGAGRGPSDGRSPAPSDPWSAGWTPPTDAIVEDRHARARSAQQSGRVPSQCEPQDEAEDLEAQTFETTATSDHEVDAPDWVSGSRDLTAGVTRLLDDLIDDSPAEPLAAARSALTNGDLAVVATDDGQPSVVAPTILDVVEGSLAVQSEPIDEPAPPPPPPPPPPEPTNLAEMRRVVARNDETRRRHTRRFDRVVSAVVITATAYWYYTVATLLLAVAVPLVAGWNATTVMSGSMEPVISPGDVVAFADWDGNHLAVGTIIQFDDPVRAGETTTHRVVGIDDDGNYLTKGDANAAPDSTPVRPEAIVGVATLVSPHAGLPQYWWATQQLTWFGGWAAVTAAAFSIMSVHSRFEAPVRRRWVRVAVAGGLIAAFAGVGTAAWSSAAFADGTANPDSSLGAATTFSDVTHHGSLGVATCSTSTSTVFTLGSDLPAGRTLIVRYAMRNRQQNATLGATDTKGNSYRVDAYAVNGGRTQTAIISGAINTPLVAGDQITVTHPRGRAVIVSFDEFSGIAAGAPVSVAGTATGNSATPSVALTIPDDNTFTIGSLSLRGTATLSAPTGSWAFLDFGTISCSRSMSYGGTWAEENLSTTLTFDPGLSRSRRWAAAAVAYLIG